MEFKFIVHRIFVIVWLSSIVFGAPVGLPGIRPAAAQAQTTFGCSAVSEIPQAECEALVALYNATGGESWYNHTGWLQTTTPCSWFGVTCSDGHITGVNFRGNFLRGVVPPEFGNLTALTTLDLGSYISCDFGHCGTYTNSLISLPPEFGNLSSLTYLNLNQTSLSSLPPKFGNLSNLTVLHFGYNDLTTLPPALFNLTNLTELNLGGNDLTILPPEIGNLTKLTKLDLYTNRLTALPPEISNLADLTNLNLSTNSLASLPPEFSDLADLNELDLSANNMSALPPEIITLPNLTTLHLWSNNLTSLPQEFFNLVHLNTLTLDGNPLGALPPEFGNLTALTDLYLSSSDLTSLPPEFGNLVNLKKLSLQWNNLAALPPEFGDLINLTDLNLGGNDLTALPLEFGNFASLTNLDLNGNSLTTLPPTFGNLSNLTSLDLSSNNLTALPPEFGSLTDLAHLNLYENGLTTLPPEFGNLSNLSDLRLLFNQLNALPPEFGNLTNLTYLDLCANNLTALPPEFGNLVKLNELWVVGNPLRGAIPTFMTRLTSLTYFVFSTTDWCVPSSGSVYEWVNQIDYIQGNQKVCSGWPPDTLTLASEPELFPYIAAPFTATVAPATANVPITFTWNIGALTPTTHIKETTADTIWLTWDTPGEYVITVTAANDLGAVSATRTVLVHAGSSTVVLPDAPASLTYTDTQGLPTTLDLPAGSVTQTAALLYRPQPDPAIIPAWRPAGHAFSLNLYREGRALPNPSFTHPLTLTLHYSAADSAGIDRPADLQLMRRDAGGWQPAACGPISHDLEQRTLSLPLCRLGEFALFGPATLTKFVEPATPVRNGDTLTYTLVFSNPDGGSLRLFDPISPTLTWQGFVSAPPEGIAFSDGAISGALTLSPTLPLTLSFTVHVTLPQTATAPLPTAVANTAFFCWAQHTVCIFQPSNTVSNPLIATRLFLPLLLRTPSEPRRTPPAAPLLDYPTFNF